ncbi:MAG: thiamine pyrophosphate-dependent dehydrogenase E1 component subunit alpha [Desulfovibrio sp.]|nr:thiamine pyrophosphate-dependent dehydrogenase E1 component subunit alpha [Desulfovibrio sp.]MBI4957954.1 thiamine pyrophosphate-dependent dehydrogenase E1 component subunit alpha [Desulfovibrio sp.]
MRMMLFIRRFEERVISLYPQQEMKTPIHLCIGQEAVAAGVCAHLTPHDYLSSTHRSHGHCLAKGMDPQLLLAEFYGKVTGCCRGKGGSMHAACPERGILGTSAIVGGGIPIGVGHALAAKLRMEKRLSVVFFGDGASEEGSFQESLNFAVLKELPVVFVCENNFYATNSPLKARQPHQDIHRRAASFGSPAEVVDGNNVWDVYRAAERAVRHARAGRGPYFLECRTYRWQGHVGPNCDWQKGCRPKGELLEWMDRCPVEAFRSTLMREGILDEPTMDSINREVSAILDSAVLFAQESTFPDAEEVMRNVYYMSGA